MVVKIRNRGRPPNPKKKGRPPAPKKRGRPPKVVKKERPKKPVIEKQCPQCKAMHTKPGTFCGNSCANVGKATKHPESNINRSKKLIAYYESPEGIATRKKQSVKITAYNKKQVHEEIPSEEYYIEIPDVKDLSDYSDLLIGYDIADKW